MCVGSARLPLLRVCVALAGDNLGITAGFQMDVFDFREKLIEEYARFSRSFTRIRAKDIREKVDASYQDGKFWPDPLIQLNPNFASGGTIDDLVSEDVLDAECAKIFRIKEQGDTTGRQLELYKHQAEAVAIAQERKNYVLTTGTGSGKSLGYFIPIVDDVLRRKKSGEAVEGITAIVVYPMNTLCNSQLEELKKFLEIGYGEGNEPVTFARYTGQESSEERERIAKSPPDILLTNYVMLELLMTRLQEDDKALRRHAVGLRFLVLDELHTYRGRQGADVAMLLRRVRERFDRGELRFVGTSATIISRDTDEDTGKLVADVATRMFGDRVESAHVITETLEPVTNENVTIEGPELRAAIEAGPPEKPTYKELAGHSVSAWVERKLSLEEQDGKLVRILRPKTVAEASKLLAKDSGLPDDTCRSYLTRFLLAASQSQDDRGRNFFAFRLHQFISGAWDAYCTLHAPGKRYITMEGQQFNPKDRDSFLFNLSFCRECGQEYFPVWAELDDGNRLERFTPRNLNDRSRDEEDDRIEYGYLMSDATGIFDADDLECFPGEWLELRKDEPKIKYSYRKHKPVSVQVDTRGNVTHESQKAWFVPGSFRFCLNRECGVYYPGKRSDLSKLSGLSSEGRSSATTVLTLSSLKYLIGTDLDEKTKKLLAFTDNRQDASLQAGHFNDFIHILLLRGALLAAIQKAPGEVLTDETVTQQVFDSLNLKPGDYSANPGAKGVKAENTRKTLRDVLGYRLYYDLRRGWRITNPNLEQLDLLKIQYKGLEDCCKDEEEWGEGDSLLGKLTPELRHEISRELLDHMRGDLCVKTIYLDSNFQSQMRNRSFNDLKETWGLSEDEKPLESASMVPRMGSRARRQGRRRDERVVYVSHRSAFGRRLKAILHRDDPQINFNEAFYNDLIDHVLNVLNTYGYVESQNLENDRIGYRLDGSVIEWRRAENSEAQGSTNRFFRTLYENIASLLNEEDCFLHQLEAREHTAQVETEAREKREMRFRKGLEAERIVDEKVEPAGLPILFCSPTMELGVDISTLNTVYMRNVPPSPANYTQRSGRAGRSGQPALVVTYCAAKSPHDQYFFSDPAHMVAGAVRPPNIDLANEDLILSHVHAVWLAETDVRLPSAVCEVLDRNEKDRLPLLKEITKQIESSKAIREATKRAERILDTLKDDLVEKSAPWYTSTWLPGVLNSIQPSFEGNFRRWRSLYRATMSQMQSANNILDSAAASERDRKDAKDRHDEAYTQQKLLLDQKPGMNSDFYTYRYLAAEGFLPGYNFPRLPLMAFIPARSEHVVRDTFLSRPRFLGLSEFGPQSIIYHEGSTYRVKRAILTIRGGEERTTASTGLVVEAARVCPDCGYGHFEKQRGFERCISCDALLEDGTVISNLYRIEQVSAQRAMRITSDEEERQRQGYEMVTTFRYSEAQGEARAESIALAENEEGLLEIKYGPAATLWRINLGWRRRRDKSIYGFSIDASTGEWSKDSQAPTDVEDDDVLEGKSVERISPYVQDTRNILILEPKIELSEGALITLQYALKRGIEQVFQLEESELAAEPLPNRKKRNAILFYEAAEGGAGVLTRLVADPKTMGKIASKALEVCHYVSHSGEWRDADDLVDVEDQCVAGCYRCLLSYYNQIDHACIDRRDQKVHNFLCRLKRSNRVTPESSPGAREDFDDLIKTAGSSLEKRWLKYLHEHVYRLPDRSQPYLEEYDTRPDFAYSKSQVLIYIDGPHHEGDSRRALDETITRRLESSGFNVIRFTSDQATWDDTLKKYAWVFGSGKAST